MTVPVPHSIINARISLRQFVADDWRALHEHYSDPECTRFAFGRALAEGESWRAMASMVGHWQLRGFGPYAVVEQASAAVVGTVGLWFPNDWPEPEIKWALLRKAWGKGFAVEAAKAVQSVAIAHFGRPPISLIGVQNLASIKVAKAVGATLGREILFRGNPCHIDRHPHSPAQ
ncbi:MAG: GNAT family N-acetyltransferase [Burkholderiaceae bacterium]